MEREPDASTQDQPEDGGGHDQPAEGGRDTVERSAEDNGGSRADERNATS
jgi:hypothetical protein